MTDRDALPGASAANFRGLYLLELGIRRQNYNRPAVSEPDEVAIRFE
jgi:hypothetical protein